MTNNKSSARSNSCKTKSESLNSSERDYRIDNIRALCIVLVVFAHSIIAYNGKWGIYTTGHTSDALRYLCNFIYIFHMPLFFSISGFLFHKKATTESLAGMTSKKLVRLLVPFILVGTLYMIPIRLLSQYPNYSSYTNAVVKLLIGQDGGHLWFLPALFMIFVFEHLIVRYIKSNAVRAVLIIALTLLGFVVPLHLGQALSNIMWFHLGYRIKECGAVVGKKLSYSALLIFLIFAPAYLLLPESIKYYGFISFGVKVVAAASAIVYLYGAMPNRKCKTLSFIATNSFGVYLLHSPLIYLTFCYLAYLNPSAVMLINFVGLGSLSLLLSLLVGRTKLSFMIGAPCRKARN